MNEESKNAMIKGGCRTLLAIVPSVGGAIATAWNEYDTYKQNQRIEEFFERFGKRLKELEEQHGDLKDKVAQLPDAPELLDKIVDLVKREPSERKRMHYVVAFGSFVSAPTETSPDNRQSILESVNNLTDQDIGFLTMFRQSPKLRGDMITNTTGVSIVTGNEAVLNRQYEAQLGPAIQSLAKLESRGLITPDEMNAMFSSTGESAAWYNKFRQKVWRITPTGSKFLQALGV